MYASIEGKVDEVEFLLGNGADINLTYDVSSTHSYIYNPAAYPGSLFFIISCDV